MNIENTIGLFAKDLEKLASEVESYPSEKSLWVKADGINNCAGNLALHLVGNLNYFIGAVLGKTGYARNRDAEFEDKDIPRDQLVADIKNTVSVIEQVLRKLDPKSLNETYPIEVFSKPMTTEYFLMHLYGHLNYHLGQVNYHRRLLT